MSQSPESVLSLPEICDLLDTLQKLLDKYTSSKMKKRVFYNREATVVRNWVSERESKVKKDSTTLLAFFSLVLPYFRMDRHYFIKEHNLSSVLAKAMGVGPKTVEEFEQWRTRYGDFGLAVENVLKRRGTQVDCRALSAVQVNESLDTLANRTSFNVTSEKTIAHIIHNCSPSQAKWFVRIILKTFPLDLVTRLSAFKAIHPDPWPIYQKNASLIAMSIALLDQDPQQSEPRIGVPIMVPNCKKGRGCLHVCKMLERHCHLAYVETKYDGQRMQIHVDLSRPFDEQIRLFNKKGVDCTKRRAAVIPTLREALEIGTPLQNFREKLILDSELVLWDQGEEKIAEYHELSAHLNKKANNRDPDETVNLMAVFFDALYIDGKPLVEETYYDRTRLLYRLITTKPGRAIFSERFSLSLTELDAASSDLANRYSEAIRDRKEGFVLKPADSTYVGYPNWVKLKKDYIEGFGDNLDFVLVGGGYSPERGRTSTKLMSGRKCNEWHVACWQNKEEVWRNNARPLFTVMFTVTHIPESVLRFLDSKLSDLRVDISPNRIIKAETFDIVFKSPKIPPIDVLFSIPVVAEIYGGCFTKPSGEDYYIPRFPRLSKIHTDRDFTDAVTCVELAEAAERALAPGDDEDGKYWNIRLKGNDVPDFSVGRGRLKEVTLNIEERRKMEFERYGVWMEYELNLDGLLNASSSPNTELPEETPKRKALEEIQPTSKRICATNNTMSDTPSQTSKQYIPLEAHKLANDKIRTLFSSATLFAAVRSHREQISSSFPAAVFLDLTDLEIEQENEFPYSRNISTDSIVLVNMNSQTYTKAALVMARKASRQTEARWHVFHWEIVRRICMSEDTHNLNNDRLWSYFRGDVLQIRL